MLKYLNLFGFINLILLKVKKSKFRSKRIFIYLLFYSWKYWIYNKR